MGKPKTINVDHVYDVELDLSDAGRFVLRFKSEKYNIRLNLKRQVASYIGSELWKFVKDERAAIERVARSLKGDE